MMPLVSHNLKSRLKFMLSRAALCLCMGTLAAMLSGCAAAALAPLALQALGFGIKTGTMLAHSNDKNPDETEALDDTMFDGSEYDQKNSRDSQGKCNELVLITPSIIEFRTDQTGSMIWRELGLGGSADAPRWAVVAAADSASAKDVAPGGWSPANNLGNMSFTPPLKTDSKPGNLSFLAYAPAESYTAPERDQLASLVLDFGPVAGTFHYKERIYKYSTLKELPCFPVPQ
jgi:hypothetical protein